MQGIPMVGGRVPRLQLEGALEFALPGIIDERTRPAVIAA